MTWGLRVSCLSSLHMRRSSFVSHTAYLWPRVLFFHSRKHQFTSRKLSLISLHVCLRVCMRMRVSMQDSMQLSMRVCMRIRMRVQEKVCVSVCLHLFLFHFVSFSSSYISCVWCVLSKAVQMENRLLVSLGKEKMQFNLISQTDRRLRLFPPFLFVTLVFRC